MPLTFTLQFTNIGQLDAFLGRFTEAFQLKVIPQTLADISSTMFNFLDQKEHRLTGAMRASTRIEPVSEEEIDVGVGVIYAHKENQRPGDKEGVPYAPHNFWEPSIGGTITAVPGIVEKNLSTLEGLA